MEKMFFYYMILLFLSWPRTRCIENTDLEDGEIFDQLATASENVVRALRPSNASSKDLQEPLLSISSSESTVYYENSNGFIPIIPSVSPSYDNSDSSLLQSDDLTYQDNQAGENNTTNPVSAHESSETTPKKSDEDLAYSSEARIFLNHPGTLTNRRSFDFQERPNEFELLKVNNDTPAVANYRDFYENVRSTVNTETNIKPDEPSLGRSSGKKEKRIQNVGRQPVRSSHQQPYVQYYSYNSARNVKKSTYEQEKVPGNYREQDTTNYSGHGQSATRQNAAAISSSSRTNYEANELTHSGTHSGTYDNTAESLKTRYRFSKPVVVAEPNNYKVDIKLSSQLQNNDSDNDYKTLGNSDSSSAETSNRHEIYNDNSRQRSYHRTEDSKNLSDESADYSEYIERPRKVQKSRRRPAYPDPSRKLLKEHRVDDSVEEQDKHKHNSLRLKSQRYKVKANPWANDVTKHVRDESVEDVKHHFRDDNTETKSSKKHGPKLKNTWNHVSPNLEISHSNGIELDQLEKPKLVVPLNLVPVANFDHATALGNSQGFDVSNAVMQNFVTAAPIGTFSTNTPFLSTPQPILTQNLALAKNLANVHNLGISTPVPDIIVGQNTFQNPVHTILLPQQNKLAETLKTTYVPNTMSPVFALTSSLTPTLHGVRLQNLQGNVTPRTTFAVTPTATPIVQQVPINHVHSGVQQLIVPQSTVPTFSTFVQTPLQTNSGYQIQVNPYGVQGSNLINHANLQVQGLSTTPTLLSGQSIPEGRINLVPADSQSRKNAYSASGTNFLASASLAVGQNEQKHAANAHSNIHQVGKAHEGAYQMFKDVGMTPKTKTVIQAAQTIPNVLQTNPILNSMAVNTQQLISAQQNLQDTNLLLQRSRDDAMQQLQFQFNRAQIAKNHKLPSVTLHTIDNTGSHSNNVNTLNTIGALSGNAHLPNVGTKNVEIVNPNIKPSPIDPTVMNAFNTMQYPTTILTTPIPIFSTIAPVTPQTISLQNYVDSLTETGAKAKQVGIIDFKTLHNHERPMFNPINFVPNMDIIRNQNALNNKLPINEPLQEGLSLVPVMPGGNFFKPSVAAQSELVVKPKLASDLQKYAEEMFKESLKTMYNSQKWNNDRKPPGNAQNNSEAHDLAKLKTEVQKLKASLSDSKYKDIFEAHQSENKLRTSDAPKSSGSGSKKKKPDTLLTTLEHLLKTRPSGPIHIYHGGNRPVRKHKPRGDSISNFPSGFHDDFDGNSHVTDFLTPPRPNLFHSKGSFHDIPVKKRPGSSRFKNGPWSARPSNLPPSRLNGLETSASNMDVHLDGSYFHHRSPFDHNFDFDSRHYSSFDMYPTFTTSTPDILNSILEELKTSKTKDYDINHPKMHNLLGLLMKNKQLPSRGSRNQGFRNKDQLKQFFENDKRWLQHQFHDGALRDHFLDKSDGGSQSSVITSNRKVYPGNGTV